MSKIMRTLLCGSVITLGFISITTHETWGAISSAEANGLMGGQTRKGAIPEYNENLEKLAPLERTKLLFENVLYLVPSYDGFHFTITSLKEKPELSVAKEALHALAAETSNATEKDLLLHVAALYETIIQEDTISWSKPKTAEQALRHNIADLSVEMRKRGTISSSEPKRSRINSDSAKDDDTKPIRIAISDVETNALYMIGTPVGKIGKHPHRTTKTRDLTGAAGHKWEHPELQNAEAKYNRLHQEYEKMLEESKATKANRLALELNDLAGKIEAIRNEARHTTHEDTWDSEDLAVTDVFDDDHIMEHGPIEEKRPYLGNDRKPGRSALKKGDGKGTPNENTSDTHKLARVQDPEQTRPFLAEAHRSTRRIEHASNLPTTTARLDPTPRNEPVPSQPKKIFSPSAATRLELEKTRMELSEILMNLSTEDPLLSVLEAIQATEDAVISPSLDQLDVDTIIKFNKNLPSYAEDLISEGQISEICTGVNKIINLLQSNVEE